MSRLIVSLSLLFFIATISIGGCDGGGIGEVIEPTPMPEPTPEPSEACSNCPCDFFSIPMTTECWPRPQFRPDEAQGVSLCSLVPRDSFFGFGVAILPQTQCTTDEGFGCCVVYPDGDTPPPRTCTISETLDLESLHSNQEVLDCRTCLEFYASELNDAGINVSGGPPYICDD